MATPGKLNELRLAEVPARELLGHLGWTYEPREALAAERGDGRAVLLEERLVRALRRLNEWMTEAQAERVLFELEHVEATGMARNQRVHEYLIHGMPLDVDTLRGRRTWIRYAAAGRASRVSSTSLTPGAVSTSLWSRRSFA